MSRQRKKKTDVNLYYNETKGGIDSIDQITRHHSMKRGTRRWPLCIFFTLIDIASLNGGTIFMKNNPDWNKKKHNVSKPIISAIESVLGKTLPSTSVAVPWCIVFTGKMSSLLEDKSSKREKDKMRKSYIEPVLATGSLKEFESDVSQLHVERVSDSSDSALKWTHNLTKLLLNKRLENELSFNRLTCKKEKLWNDIAQEISKATTVSISGEACDIKYRNLLATYRANKKKQKLLQLHQHHQDFCKRKMTMNDYLHKKLQLHEEREKRKEKMERKKLRLKEREIIKKKWLRQNKHKVWDSNPTCRGPGDLGGRHIEDMEFDDLCIGQWASMTKLAPRLPIK
ncbi:hypothetical protein ANN_14677 [Periplaneta americana]|uniref:Uncharacterized protein n=1 Tax=Periplaneta americana TaxID=6978 RepID=A0ABQ8SXK7_PERAM|nr:hypothetical protein ANN_14677 [Periplaneta americana]